MLNRVIVVPLTSQTTKVYPGEALVTLNGEPRKAMADQIMSAAKQRLRAKLGGLAIGSNGGRERGVAAVRHSAVNVGRRQRPRALSRFSHAGLDVRELPLLAEREKYFLSTSHFIEPVQEEVLKHG